MNDKTEHIKRGALKAHYAWLPKEATLTPKDFDDIIDAQSAVDVVSIEAYKQIMWERDMAIEQLAEYGVSLGEKKRDVEPVVRCSACRYSSSAENGYEECLITDSIHQPDFYCSLGRRCGE